MDGGRSKEPTRIANLRKRLQRIEHTKQRMAQSGRPPDRRQVSALDSEEEVRGEIGKWEKYGVLQPPQHQSQPRIREHPMETPMFASAGVQPDGVPSQTMPSNGCGFPQFEPFNPNMVVDREVVRVLAYPQVQRMEKEPTRIVNLRRRLQRILATHEKLERPDQPLPDNRQMAALVAEAEIVWEIDKWERFRIIYPNKPEMQYIPPGSLGSVGDRDDIRDRQSHHSVGSGSTGSEDRSADERSVEGSCHNLIYNYNPAPMGMAAAALGASYNEGNALPSPRAMAMGIMIGSDGTPVGCDVMRRDMEITVGPGKGGYGGKGGKGAKGKGAAEILNPALTAIPMVAPSSGTLPPDVNKVKTSLSGSNIVIEPSVPISAHYPGNVVPYTTTSFPPAPIHTDSHGNSNEKRLLPPALAMEAPEVGSVMAKDIPKEPTRIVNLRRRLHRIQNTKAKLAQAWGPQPDNRQMAALEAEPAILWEIQQWEQYGVLTKADGPADSHGNSSGDSMRDSSTLTEGCKDLQEGEGANLEHWVQAVEEAHAEERKRHQQIARKERMAARLKLKEALARELSDSSSDTSEGADGDALLAATESPDMPGRRRELFHQLTSKMEDSVMTRIRRRGGSLLDTKYYKQGDPDLLRVSNGKRRSGAEGSAELVEPTWLPPTSELKVIPGLTPKPTHFLENSWTIWFDESEEDEQVVTLNNYLEVFTELGSFNTIQGFWMYWNNLRVDNLRENCNLRLFKSDIKPTWEDPHNSEGGRWVAANIPKSKRSKLWGDIVMAMVGELTEDNSHESICGVVLSTRHQGDRIQLWIDGGYLYRMRPDLYHVGEDYRDTRATMQKLAEICDFDDDVHFVYQCHALCYRSDAGVK